MSNSHKIFNRCVKTDIYKNKGSNKYYKFVTTPFIVANLSIWKCLISREEVDDYLLIDLLSGVGI